MDIVKKTWKRVKSGRLWDLYMQVCDRAVQIGLWSANKPFPLLFTRKSFATLGTCFHLKQPDGSCALSITVSEVMLGFSDDQLRELLVHEFGHAVHPGEGHNAAWRRDANRIGAKWGYVVEVRNSDKQILAALRKEDTPRYEVYCPRCGKTWRYKRRGKVVQHPEKYLCPKDNTHLALRSPRKK